MVEYAIAELKQWEHQDTCPRDGHKDCGDDPLLPDAYYYVCAGDLPKDKCVGLICDCYLEGLILVLQGKLDVPAAK